MQDIWGNLWFYPKNECLIYAGTNAVASASSDCHFKILPNNSASAMLLEDDLAACP